MSVLAKDRERLLADLAVGQPGVGLTQTVGIRAFELDSFDATTQKTRSAYSRYIGSKSPACWRWLDAWMPFAN